MIRLIGYVSLIGNLMVLALEPVRWKIVSAMAIVYTLELMYEKEENEKTN